MDEPIDKELLQPGEESETKILDGPQTSLARDDTAPSSRIIGNYHIIRKLGEGGMGVVYEAEQQHPRRLVALKVIRGGLYANDYQMKLFHREVQVLARLKHPGIADIYESGTTEDGQHFFAMELVRGLPLLNYVKGHRLNGSQAPVEIRQRVELFLKLCEAISYAHQRGVIHRDLKPANILVSAEHEAQSSNISKVSHADVKVLDFGLARIIDDDAAGVTGLTEVGQIKGTLAYMSPEQARARPDEIDVRTDVYSLGVILYELLAERLPYEVHARSIPEAIRVICEETPRPPSRILNQPSSSIGTRAQRIDRDLETIALKALEKEPARRYQSVAALAEDVARYLTNRPIMACPPSAFYQFRKLVARHKLPFALIAMVFVLLLGFAITMTVQAARIARERDRAVAAERLAAEQRNAAEQERKLADEARGVTEKARISEREQREAAEKARLAEKEQRLFAEANFRRAEEQKSLAEEQKSLAEEQKSLAEEQRSLAEEQRSLAEQRELSNRRLLYDVRMNLAQQAYEAADTVRMRDLMEGYVPKAGQEDMRGFEWHYLWGQIHREQFIIRDPANSIDSIAISPDGKSIATGGDKGTVKIWDAVTGQQLNAFSGQFGVRYPVNSVAFSPNGKKLAACGSLLVVWDVATGQQIFSSKGRTLGRCTLAFAPFGGKLATGGEDNKVKLWDADSGQELLTFEGHTGWVRAIAFSPDGRRLATASWDATVKLWDVDTNREIATLKGHQGSIFSLAYSPDGKHLVSGGVDRMVIIWDVATGKLQKSFQTDSFGSVAYSPDGKRIATVGRAIKMWDAATGRELITLIGHEDGVTSVAFSPDGKQLVTGSRDRTVRFWNAFADREMVILKGHNAAVSSVAFSPDGKRLATSSYDRTAKLWDAATGRQLITFEGHAGRIWSAAFSPDGKILATTSEDKTINLWNINTGQALITLKDPPFSWCSVFSPDGKWLATGNADGTVKLWNANANFELITLKGHAKSVLSVAFSPDGKILATTSEDKTIKLWNVTTGQERITIDGHTDTVLAGAFSPDGKILATGSGDRTIKLWDVATGQDIITLKGHATSVSSVAFSPDGKRLASSSGDRTLKLWNITTGQELITLKDGYSISSVAFSPDGYRIAASAFLEGIVRLWDGTAGKKLPDRGER